MVLALGLLVIVPAVILWRITRRNRDFGSLAEEATYATLHTAAQASPALRGGLRPQTAEQAVRPLRRLVGDASLTITDRYRVLAWAGPGEHHGEWTVRHAAATLATGRAETLSAQRVRCGHPDCEIRGAVIAPLVVDDQVVGTLAAYASDAGPSLARTTAEVARWVSSQLELAELDASRARLAEAEVRALRAQISPHFIYNALTAIASYVRTDPEHARELLLEFADFTRYSFRRARRLHDPGRGAALDRPLPHPRARPLRRPAAGHRARRARGAAGRRAVPVPAADRGERRAARARGQAGPGRITILAEDDGSECRISLEDDGVGADPEQIRGILTGEGDSDSIGVGNVDERMRSVFGDEYGLVVETGSGPRHEVSMRVPEVPPGGPRHDEPPPACASSPSTTRRPPAPSSPTCSGATTRIAPCSPPPTAPRRCACSSDATSTRSSSTSACRASTGSTSRASCAGSPRRPVVFVSAYDTHAVEAFDLRAVDYLMKPVRAERVREAVTRISGLLPVEDQPGRAAAPDHVDEVPAAPCRRRRSETIAVELGGVTRFVQRSDVRYVEAHGDYARLVTPDGRHLVRVSLSALEEQWADAGFVRIHRRWLVTSLTSTRCARRRADERCVVGDAIACEVSRRHTRELRDRLVRTRPARAADRERRPSVGVTVTHPRDDGRALAPHPARRACAGDGAIRPSSASRCSARCAAPAAARGARRPRAVGDPRAGSRCCSSPFPACAR